MLAAPDDDGPRLVYADVLQERGDERGEFIPLQCELAKWSARADPERFAAMRAREGALLEEHGRAWIEQATPFRDCYFYRGFVEELHCLAGELLARGLEVAAPVRVLRLDGDTSAEVAQRVMALPMGARVKELTLRLVDSAVDNSLRGAGKELSVVRQLSAEANALELLDQLGWLRRLKRLELPLAHDGGALLEGLARLKPVGLQQLWLHRQGPVFGRDVLLGIDSVWAALPALAIRWRGTDYRAADVDALLHQLDPFYGRQAPPPVDAELPAVVVELDPPPPSLGPTLVRSDPLEAPAPRAPMELVPLTRSPPSTALWDRWLEPEGLRARGFLPRARPQSVTLLRAEEQGGAVLVALGPVGSAGAASFAEDLARLMALPRDPLLLQVDRIESLGPARWVVFEPFEGASLRELLRLQPRLPAPLVLRVLGQTARAAAKVEGWRPSSDDVLIDVLGRVRLLPGFPSSARAEEPGELPQDEPDPFGVPPDDAQAPGARVAQLGSALFELLTGTRLVESAGRGWAARAVARSQQLRQLEHTRLPLAQVDPALEPFDALVARATAHGHAERFAGLSELADALEGHPQAAAAVELAQWVRRALPNLPRTRDGR